MLLSTLTDVHYRKASLTKVRASMIYRYNHKYVEDSLTRCPFSKTEILRLTLRTYDLPSHGLSTRFAVSSINFLLWNRSPVPSESERLYSNLHTTIAPAIASFLKAQYCSTQGSLLGKTLDYFSPQWPTAPSGATKASPQKGKFGISSSFMSLWLWNKICRFFINEVLPSSWEIEDNINSLWVFFHGLWGLTDQWLIGSYPTPGTRFSFNNPFLLRLRIVHLCMVPVFKCLLRLFKSIEFSEMAG